MQFKKHFSSNLKNLSIKNTYVMPPPRLDHNYSLNSENNTDRTNSPLIKHRHCSSALAEITDNNKENYYVNAPPVYRISECLSSSRKQTTERQRYNDSGLSFNKIKQGLVDAQELCNRKINNTNEGNHFRKSNYQMSSSILKQSNSVFHLKSKSKGKGNGVRMGSMVFSSLSKAGEKKVSRNVPESMKQSQSYDRFKQIGQSKVQMCEIQCLNNDGRYAKYKVRSQNQDEELLYYCFECTGPLVKQGFEVDLLTQNDKQTILKQQRTQRGMSHYQNQNQSVLDTDQTKLGNRKAKIGQQIKCRIIMRINKLKVQKEEFNSNIERHLENIDYFYNSLTTHIEQHRLNQRQQIIRMQKIQKTQPENYQNKLSSSLGNLDYMVKHLQTVNYDYLQEAEAILDEDISYPKFRPNLQPKEGFQRKIQEFISYFDRNIKLDLEQRQQIGNESRSRCKTTSQVSQSQDRNNSLRFSFEQALQQSRKNKQNRHRIGKCYQMNPLQQENESELEQSMYVQPQRKDAFRNLFPEQDENEQQLQMGKQSPVFKQF